MPFSSSSIATFGSPSSSSGAGSSVAAGYSGASSGFSAYSNSHACMRIILGKHPEKLCCSIRSENQKLVNLAHLHIVLVMTVHAMKSYV